MDRRDLRQYVRAIPLIADHFLNPAHLPFDAPQALQAARLDVGVDAQ
jgi:hypothetical protein